VEVAAKGDTGYTVEHDVGELFGGGTLKKHGRKQGRDTHDEIEEVDDCPANLLGHAGDGVDDDLARDDEDDVDEPCA
jgi:hypothetical protein